MSAQQLAFYKEKLDWEIDSWDLYIALKNGEKPRRGGRPQRRGL